MRCLYCGKGLAFLKRWTGGGEFCSDAHRQRYQEEYNQLALNRLLQGNAVAEPGAPGAAKSQTETTPEVLPSVQPATPEMTPGPKRLAAPLAPAVMVADEPPPQAAVVEVAQPEPVQEIVPERHVEPEPQVEPEPDEPAPAPMAGFLLELPVFAAAEVKAMSAPELEFLLQSSEPALPGRNFIPDGEIDLPPAGHVDLPEFFQGMDCAAHPRERNFELREFVRTTLVVEVSLQPAGETALETGSVPLEILFAPYPPKASPALWQEQERAFRPCALELGELARLDFETTGLPEAAPEEVSTSHAPAAMTTPPTAPRVNMVVLEPAALFAPKPHASEPVVVALLDETPDNLPGSKLKLLPEIVTKPALLTLHGVAAGRAKPMQVFPSAVSSGVAVMAPRSDGLPLRPVMTMGPAPSTPTAKAPLAIRSEPVRTPVSDPRFANGNLRKPEARVAETERREAERRNAENREVGRRDTERRQADRRQPAPAAIAAEETRPVAEVKPPEAPVSAPVASAAHQDADLRLPQLQLTTSENFLSKLPMVVKAGLAAVIVLGIGGGIYFAKGSGKTVKSAADHTMGVGAVLPIDRAGWITDFAPDPAGGHKRQVSVLRGALNLTNYRLDFQGQIENNAFGWVFRAMNAKNFYVGKLEIVRPGSNPSVDFVRFAVINGAEQPRTHIPLRMPLKPDTLYRIRVDAVGDRFTTWVQDQKVDEWTENSIGAGGVGLYNERGERGSLNGDLSVASLVMK